MGPTTNASSSSTTVVRGDGNTMRNSNGYSLGVSAPGPQANGPAAPSSSGSKRPYAHFDDLKQVQLDVTSTTPVEKVLGYAESCLKQAGFMKDFGRLDIALQEYLRATIALLEVLPSNSDWLSVMTDRKGARVRYNALMAQINADSSIYEKIKAQIQEDNKRTGVRPQNSQGHSRSQSQSQSRPSLANGLTGETNGRLSADEPAARGTATANSGAYASPPAHAPPPPPATSPEKPKPKPKPQALHGRALRPGAANSIPETGDSSKTAQELAERFANLRTAKAASPSPQPQQDPRIRTQPINHTSFPPQQQPHPHTHQQQQQPPPPPYTQFQLRPLQHPSGFENLPPPPAPPPHNPPILHALPDLPKVPEAIYSPARGSVSSQSSQLPAPTQRTFNRTNSTTSFSGTGRTPAAQPAADDYFSFQSTLERQQRQYPESAAPIRSRVTIPEGDTITAEELLSFMQAGSRDIQILVIDIRSREEYDEGHIMSQSTICVDFDILQRENISANDIADSMVLAPASETRLFDRRRDFDLIVYYDQDSETIRPYHDSTSAADIAVASLYNALSYYDFEADEQANRRPKLLKGGLDSWVSMMGTASLQTSSTAAGTGSGLSRAQASNRHRQNMLSRPHGRYMAKPIQDAAEAKRWEESLKDMDKSSFVRTTDDFLRRFPPVSAIQESMTAPALSRDDSEVGFHPSGSSYLRSSASQERPSSSRSTVLTEPGSARTSSSMPPPPYAPLPAPPTRPAPTVPKPSHSDLEGVDEDDHYLRTKKAKAAISSSGGRIRRQKVGLYNPGNWCYGNSSVQSLFASGAFSEELTTGAWGGRWKVPMKADEKISHPQLLAKIMANSFHWMQYGKFEAMKAKTLMDYCYHIHSKDYDGSTKTDRSTIFGGPYQQDAQEFISFLLDNLHDETNRLRDHTGEVQQPPLGPRSTPLSNGLQYWDEYRRYNDSIVDKYWRGIEVTDRRCRSCGHPSLTYEHFDALHLPIPPTTSSSATSLQDLLLQYCSADVLPEYKCDQCSRIDTTEKHVRLVRLPELLCISFRRFQGNEHYGFHKNNTAVVFPINGLDMTPYTVQQADNGQEVAALGIAEPQFRPPFVYDCYAVIVHSGTLKSGHYRAFVKDEPIDSGSISNGDGGNVDVSAASPVPSTSLWHHFDDARVEPVTIGSGDGRDMARRLYRDNNQASAYMVFYKRRRV